MKKNIGGIDGFLRMLVAIVLILVSIVFGPWWLGLFSLPLIVTNYMMYCPVYDIVGLDFAGAPANRH
jgi:hypothetical protein